MSQPNATRYRKQVGRPYLSERTAILTGANEHASCNRFIEYIWSSFISWQPGGSDYSKGRAHFGPSRYRTERTHDSGSVFYVFRILIIRQIWIGSSTGWNPRHLTTNSIFRDGADESELSECDRRKSVYNSVFPSRTDGNEIECFWSRDEA